MIAPTQIFEGMFSTTFAQSRQALRRAAVATITVLTAFGVVAVCGAAPAAASSASASAVWNYRSTAPTGGAGLGGPTTNVTTPRKTPAAPPAKLSGGRWVTKFIITEYWPAPEKWYVGRFVTAPGLSGKHRIDWLYSATGVSMQGEGLGLDGRMYHIDALGDGGWVTLSGSLTSASDGFAGGPPYWRAGGYWKNTFGGVTFPLSAGGWSAGPGKRYVPLSGVSFASGPSLPLHFYQSIAVDPRVIPMGSRVYLPAYRHDGHGGWFIAQDTGGAINGQRIDVYRSPPANASNGGQYITGARAYVIKPRGSH
jgi:3D (Asp-Asp-Asp) domain-containing protein